MYDFDYYKNKHQIYLDFSIQLSNIDISLKKIILLNCPTDSNLGDHAQTYCIIKWIKANYSQYTIYEFGTYPTLAFEDFIPMFKRLKNLLSKEDLIMMHSGYHLNDIHCNHYSSISPTSNVQVAAVKIFTNHKIIFFPQTIYFKTPENLNFIRTTFSTHNDLSLLCRDKVSYTIAKENTFAEFIQPFPDVVTSLIGVYESTVEKNKHLVCIALRKKSDAESLIFDTDIMQICQLVQKNNKQVFFSSTSIDDPAKNIIKSREQCIFDKIDEFASCALVITDLYHGMIFSVVAQTPVIVLKSTDHKIGSGVDWFKECRDFDNRLFFCDNFEKLPDIIQKALSQKNLTRPSSYFKDKYFNILYGLVNKCKLPI